MHAVSGVWRVRRWVGMMGSPKGSVRVVAGFTILDASLLVWAVKKGGKVEELRLALPPS